MAKVTQLISLTYDERKDLRKRSDKTGIPISRILLNAYAYWLANNPDVSEEESDKFAGIREQQDDIEFERQTGAYIGSYDKQKDKIRRIENNSRLSPEIKKFFIANTNKRYERNRRRKRIAWGVSTHGDRLEEFKESHKDILEKSKHRKRKK
jgi:hypothetical protein